MAADADAVSATATATGAEPSELSKQYETPMGLGHSTMQALKDRIKLHYDLASDYYLRLWGEHIHHGYWPTEEAKASETKEVAQVNLIKLLLDMAQPPAAARVLDVGCGIGGTSRYLAAQLGCTVTGITISGKQVDLATRLTRAEAAKQQGQGQGQGHEKGVADAEGFFRLAKGKVKFLELDAETMADAFAAAAGQFDVVWISEALSHFPNKALFFQNAHRVLGDGGKLVLADWFRADGLADNEVESDIKPIEGRPAGLKRACLFPQCPEQCPADAPASSRWHAPTATLHTAPVRRSCRGSRPARVCGTQRHQQRRQQDLVSRHRFGAEPRC